MFTNIMNMMGSKEFQELTASAADLDMTNEEHVRALIRAVTATAGSELKPELEDKLASMIVNGEVPTDLGAIMAMFGQK